MENITKKKKQSILDNFEYVVLAFFYVYIHVDDESRHMHKIHTSSAEGVRVISIPKDTRIDLD
jgi:hypothetical protein